jgi:hypothetical protein
MKKASLTFVCTVIMILVVLLTGCVAPIIKKDAGPTTTMEYNFTDFTSIEIGPAFKLEVISADTYGISINANESIFDHIDVSKTGNKLKIGMDNLFFGFPRSPRVQITMPELRGLYLSGASQANITGFKSSQDFDLTLSGASELNMNMETGNFLCEISGASEVTGYVKATSFDIVLSGASKIKVNGSSEDTKINASGASQIDMADFTVNNADISFSGASDGSLNINGRMDVSLSGGSLLEYGGNPTLGNFNLTGGSVR